MTVFNIDKLLRKKSWTGAEVGKALVTSLLYDMEHIQILSDKNYKPLFSQGELDRITRSLQTQTDWTEYYVYKELFYSLREAYNKTIVYPQTFFHGFYRYFNAILHTNHAEKAADKEKGLPRIMTEKEFKDTEKEVLEDLTQEKLSFAWCVLYSIDYFMDCPEDAPKTVWKAIQDTEKEPISNKRAIERWKMLTCWEYEEEDTKAFEEAYLATHEYIKDGERQGYEDTREYYQIQGIYKAQELFYKGLAGVEAEYRRIYKKPMPAFTPEEEEVLPLVLESLATYDRELSYLDIREPDSPYLTVETFIKEKFLDPSPVHLDSEREAEPPTNKKELLLEGVDDYYLPYNDKYPERHKKTAKAQFKEFIKDYPALFDAVSKYLQKAIPAFKGITPKDYFKESVTTGELIKKDFLDYRGVLVLNAPDSHRFSAFGKGRSRKLSNVAIMVNPRSSSLDEQGHYKKVFVTAFLNQYSYLSDAKDKRILESLRENLICSSLRYLYAFNTLMEILGEALGIEDMKIAQRPLEDLEDLVLNINKLVYNCYVDVKGTEEEKKAKREKIRESFLPIDLDALKPTAKAKKKVLEELKELGLTQATRVALNSLAPLIRKLERRD